jgi:hypothetical protein
MCKDAGITVYRTCIIYIPYFPVNPFVDSVMCKDAVVMHHINFSQTVKFS